MAAAPDLQGLLTHALKQISAAMKAIAFYPAQHPSVVSALARSGATLREALARQDQIRVGVSDVAFLLADAALGESDPALAGFASYLSRRGIGALTLRSPLEEESLKALLEVITLDPAVLRDRGGAAKCLAERRVGGVAIDDLDLAALMRTARTETDAAAPVPPPRAWNDLLARWLLGQEPTPPAGGEHLMRRAAGDPETARLLMASLQKASAGLKERGALIADALRRIAESVAAAEPEALGSLAANLAAALMELDAPARMSVLQAAIPIAGTGTDLVKEIRARLPDDTMGPLIVSLVQNEGSLNVRLGTVIRKVLIDKNVGDEQRATVLDSIRAARRAGAPPPPDVWASVEELLKESQDDWISKEYKGFLEVLGAGAPALDDAARAALMALPGFAASLTPEGIALRVWRQYADLVETDQEPARRWVALDQIEKRCARMTPGWLPDADGVAATVRGVLESAPPPPPHVAEAAARALATVAATVVRCHRAWFHRMTAEEREGLERTLEALGGHGVEPLLDSLASEEDWEIRRTYLTLLARRGPAAIPSLLKRLHDQAWYVVRNVLVILGEIGDPQTIPAIAQALAHKEPRVRRDAVAALGKIGGPRAFALLRDRLDDPDITEVATRALAAIDRPRTVGAFLERARRVSVVGRGQRPARDAILALGALGASESVPDLRAILMRALWLPPSAGDGVRIAAAQALARIGTTLALRAVEQGARLWRRPVRAACRTLLSSTHAPDGAALN